MPTITLTPYGWAYKQVSPESSQQNNSSNLYVGTSSGSGLFYSSIRFKSLFDNYLTAGKQYTITSVKLCYYCEGKSLPLYFYLKGNDSFVYGELLSPYTTNSIGGSTSSSVTKTSRDITALGQGILNYSSGNDFYIVLRPQYDGKGTAGDRITLKPNSQANPLQLEVTYEEITTSPVTTITGSFSDGTVGTSYSDSLTCDGDAPITWSLSYGSLPPGLSLSSSGNTCYVSGTPTTAGDYSFGITAANSGGSRTVGYVIGIASSSVVAPSKINYTFKNGTVGVSYSDVVTSDGTNLSWLLYGGSLPPGLNISTEKSSICTLSGTPTTEGSYTFTLMAANMSGRVTKTFTVIIEGSYTITASAETGGTIDPSGSISMVSGGSQTFTITPNSGYVVNYVAVDGASVGSVSSYTFSNVTSNHTITAYFKAATYTITASAGEGGSISPSGSTTVNSGNSQTYTITADSGYKILDVVVDGSSQGAISSYTFSSVSANHTITASFEFVGYMYVGVDDVVRLVDDFYVGVNGVARQVIVGYVGVNGVAKCFYIVT